MRLGLRLFIALLCLAPLAHASAAAPQKPAFPAPLPTTAPEPLQIVAQSDKLVWNGVVLAPDGRVFVAFPRVAGNPGPSLALLGKDGALSDYPGGGWNHWSAGAKAGSAKAVGDKAGGDKAGGSAKADPSQAFVGLSAIHLAPDNSLWVVDTGSPGFGKPALPHAAKLVQIDLAHDVVSRTIMLPADVLRPKSMLGDIRFNGAHAYITDAGAPGLIVVELASGQARRLLDGDPLTTAQRPIVVDGDIVRGPDNKPALIHADQLEVTPDGKFLYYQPLPGPMFRIPTSLLDDEHADPHAVAAGVAFWYDTPALGGTAIAPDGTLYLDDVENDSVLSLTPGRVLTTMLQDPRLHWPAAPFLRDGLLSIPAAQLDRIAAFHHGKSLIQFPVALFSLRVAAAAKPASGRP